MPTDSNHTSNHVSMEDWLDAVETVFLEPGQILEGIVMQVTPNEVLVDVGTKAEGVVPRKDLERLSDEVRAEIVEGATVRVYVVRPDEDDDHAVLSIYRALQNEDWDAIETAVANDSLIEATITGFNRGGVLAHVGQVRGFIPASHLTCTQGKSPQERVRLLRELVGQKIHVKVLDANRRRGHLILSQREAEKQLEEQRRKELLERLEEGQVVRGVVTNVTDFGAFVDLGGVDGLIHISELSWNRVSHPSEIVQVGSEVEVYVLRVDHERQRVGLSLKRLQPEPWSQVAERYNVGDEVDVTITKVVDFGAFARLEGEEVEGLIHISELAHGHVNKPSDVVSEGQKLRVRIIRIEPERKRIGLSLKALQAAEEPPSQEEFAAVQEAEPETQVADTESGLPQSANDSANGGAAQDEEDGSGAAVEFANIGADDSN